MNKDFIMTVSQGLSNWLYHNNYEATKQLMELFDKIIRHPLATPNDYIRVYDEQFYTFVTWDELVKSEQEQYDGFSEKECIEQMSKSIWMLPCGWYVQAM